MKSNLTYGSGSMPSRWTGQYQNSDALEAEINRILSILKEKDKNGTID